MDGRGADPSPALGAVLAGGRGSRLGGAKAAALLGGRPLLSYPLDALAAAGIDAVVCAKPGEEPQPRSGVEVLSEPAEPRHPLCGLVAALRHAGGRAVVAVACDLPFAAPALLAHLAAAREPLVVPILDGRPQPLLARYEHSLLGDLEAALESRAPLIPLVESLGPRHLDEAELSRFGDPRRMLFNVNTPDELRQAESLLPH